MRPTPTWLLLSLAGCGLYITEPLHLSRVDRDLDGVPASEDCDDTDPDVHEVTTWYLDADGDGVGGETTLESCNQPDGYVREGGDCDDSDPAVQYPQPWYADADGDGWGAGEPVVACHPPEGHVDRDGDCDDDDPSVYPGATEYCDGKDNDCNGLVDDDAIPTSWWVDDDGDGWGDPDTEEETCDPPPNGVLQGGDCDDTDPEVHPGALEICDGIDNNCSGHIDDDDPAAVGLGTWYVDADGDGWGDGNQPVELRCEAPPGRVDRPGDCDDTNPAVHPEHDEICDGIDNNCNGLVDEADPALVGETYFVDADGDGWGDPASPFVACSLPGGASADGTDCDDTDPTIHPGRPAEVSVDGRDFECEDGKDNDCDGLVDLDDPDCWDIDDDGIPDAIDPLYAWDCHESGQRECACAVADLLLPAAWAPYDAVKVFRGVSCTLGICSPSPTSSLDLADTDPLGALDEGAWCWDLRDASPGTYTFRWVSSRAASDPDQPVDPNSCSDWRRIDLDTACGVLGDGWCRSVSGGNLTSPRTHVDSCESGSGWALRLDWNGSSL